MDIGVFCLNMVVALCLGIAIGLERQYRQHPAGLRTNALVALGAAMYVSVALMLDREGSQSRIAAQVVSGLGFLGGGVILRDGLNVRGLNTAATIWCSGAVGTLAGLGHLPHAALGTLGILFALAVLRPLSNYIDAKLKGSGSGESYYRVQVTCPKEQAATVRNVFMRHVNSQPSMTVHGIATQSEEAEEVTVVAEIYSTERNDKYMNDVVSRISIEPSVSGVSWERMHEHG